MGRRGRPAKPGTLKVGRGVSAPSVSILRNLIAGRPNLELEIKPGKLNDGRSVFFYGAQRKGGDYHGSSGHGVNEAEAVRILVRFVEADERRQKSRATQPPLRKCVDKKPGARGAKKKTKPPAPAKPPAKKAPKKIDKQGAPDHAKYLQDLIHQLAPVAGITAKAMDLMEIDERGPLWRATFICPRGISFATVAKLRKILGGTDVHISRVPNGATIEMEYCPNPGGPTPHRRPGRPPIRHRDPPPDQTRLDAFKKHNRRPRKAPVRGGPLR